MSLYHGNAHAVRGGRTTKRIHSPSEHHMPFLIHDLSEQRSCCLPLTEHWPGRCWILMDPSLDDQRACAFNSQSLSASSEAHGRSVFVRPSADVFTCKRARLLHHRGHILSSRPVTRARTHTHFKTTYTLQRAAVGVCVWLSHTEAQKISQYTE